MIQEWTFILLLSGSAVTWLIVGLKWPRLSGQLRQPREPGPPIDPLAMLAAILLWAVAPPIVGELMQVANQSTLRRVQATCLANLVVAGGGIGVLRASGSRLPTWPGSPGQWRQDLQWGFGGFLASLLPVFSIVLLTGALRSDETQHSFLRMLAETPTLETVCWIFLAAIVCAPLTEELLFRVIFQGGLMHSMPAPAVVALVAVLFSAVHATTVERIPDAIALLPLAFILGILYYWKQSFVLVVVVHMLFNAANLIMSMLHVLQLGAGSR